GGPRDLRHGAVSVAVLLVGRRTTARLPSRHRRDQPLLRPADQLAGPPVSLHRLRPAGQPCRPVHAARSPGPEAELRLRGGARGGGGAGGAARPAREIAAGHPRKWLRLAAVVLGRTRAGRGGMPAAGIGAAVAGVVRPDAPATLRRLRWAAAG